MNYYNDNDRQCAAWLRELIKAGLIPPGDVDERSIADVTKEDIQGFTQVHFFTGIGGWPEALRLAGWDPDRHVWTGSCPCQPLSIAGVRQGELDERHLWPHFARLIRECDPPVVFGEQVASKDGREWLAGVRADLEAMGYAVGGADLCAAGCGEKVPGGTISEVCDSCGEEWLSCDCDYPILVTLSEGIVIGPPHIRQRLFWVAQSNDRIGDWGQLQRAGEGSGEDKSGASFIPEGSGFAGRVGESEGYRSQRIDRTMGQAKAQTGQQDVRSQFDGSSTDGRVADTHRINDDGAGLGSGNDGRQQQTTEAISGFWDNSILIPCADGKQRRIEPSIFPLADGIPGRVGLLRGAGNSIVPQVAAEFVRAFMEKD